MTTSSPRPAPRLKALALARSFVPASSRAAQGMTAPEMLVAVGVGSLLLMVMAQVFLSGTFAFAAMGNYVSMDSNSRMALDHMTREIRQAGNLTEFSPTRLQFTLHAQTNSTLVYSWDAGSRQLTEWKTGNTCTNILLTECDQLAFSMLNGAFTPTTNLSAGKGIKAAWKCSRTILGKKTTTEDMEQALIVMRN